MNIDFSTAPRDGTLILIRQKPGRKPRKYNDFECTWDPENDWWTIKRSRPRGISCGIITPDNAESWSYIA